MECNLAIVEAKQFVDIYFGVTIPDWSDDDIRYLQAIRYMDDCSTKYRFLPNHRKTSNGLETTHSFYKHRWC
ncbi:hypothetical protein MW887_008015 [Aspergillus wentii]|nr:hypothetical protein MW887_008015 [Aspergillus wentii]